MAHPMGKGEAGILRLDFDRRLKLEFHGQKSSQTLGCCRVREYVPGNLGQSDRIIQVGDLERCSLRPGNVHSADDWSGGPGGACSHWKAPTYHRVHPKWALLP